MTLKHLPKSYVSPEHWHSWYTYVRWAIPKLQQCFHLWALCFIFSSPCKTPISSQSKKCIIFLLSRPFPSLIIRVDLIAQVLFQITESYLSRPLYEMYYFFSFMTTSIGIIMLWPRVQILCKVAHEGIHFKTMIWANGDYEVSFSSVTAG